MALFFVNAPVFGQCVDTAWVRTYNGPANTSDEANAMAVDKSGNVYVTGGSYGSGTFSDYATIKYDSNGNQVWARRFNGLGNSDDKSTAITVDDFHNVYVTGNSVGNGTDDDFVTIKYLANGDTAWIRNYNGPGNKWDWAFAIAVDTAGFVYVTGSSVGDTLPYTHDDYVTIKYSPNGDIIWTRRYNGPGNGYDRAKDIAVDGLGNVYITGISNEGATGDDYTTIKYYPSGDTAWVRRYHNIASDEARALAIDGSGNVSVTGTSGGIGAGWDFATVKYYPDGHTDWVRRYNGPVNNTDEPMDVTVDGSGNIYVTGISLGVGVQADYCTIKYYPNGDTAWVRIYDGSGQQLYYDGANTLAVDDSGNVYVTGMSFISGADCDYATIKYLPNGGTAWVERYNGPGNGDDQAYSLKLDSFGNVYVTGYQTGSGTAKDFATIKYVQFLSGDANQDSKVTVSDVVYLINYLFKGGLVPNPIQSADVNGDDKVTVSDVVYLINYLFKGGPAPGC